MSNNLKNKRIIKMIISIEKLKNWQMVISSWEMRIFVEKKNSINLGSEKNLLRRCYQDGKI